MNRSKPTKGKNVSRNNREGRAHSDEIRAEIVKALCHDGFLSKSEAEKAAFHLTDWLAELWNLGQLFNTQNWNSGQARDVIMAFVIHAPHHLAAAHRIVMGSAVTDVFEIGAVKGTGRAKRKAGATSRPLKKPARNIKPRR